jgi:hypothetical protein
VFVRPTPLSLTLDDKKTSATPRHSRQFKRLLWLAACGFLLLAASYWWLFGTPKVTVVRTERGTPEEGEAVRITREALLQAGLADRDVTPVPYGYESPAVFARNSREPSSGYVLWRVAGSKRVWDYMVRCDWGESAADCSVTRPH